MYVASVTLMSLLFLEHVRPASTSGSLDVWLPLPERLITQLFIWLTPLLPWSFYSNITFSSLSQSSYQKCNFLLTYSEPLSYLYFYPSNLALFNIFFLYHFFFFGSPFLLECKFHDVKNLRNLFCSLLYFSMQNIAWCSRCSINIC